MSENIDVKAKEVFEDLYDKMDKRIRDLTNQVKKNVLPEAEQKLKKNIFQSVMISFGIGFIVGLIVALFGFAGGNKK